MQASYLEEWLRLFKEAKDGDNPYLRKISQIGNLKQIYTELKKLKENHYTPLEPL